MTMMPAAQMTFVRPTPGEQIFCQHSNTTYTIGEFIGEGHFGIVHACKDDWNNDLAAKALKPVASRAEVGRWGFEEIQKLLAVRHPHITYLYDAFECRGIQYLITERCHESLHDLFTNRTIQGHSILSVARCVLEAIDFMHRQGFVHQDLHLKNVFLTFARDGHGKKPLFATSSYKVGDLGVAKLISGAAAAQTRGWMLPPELIPGMNFGPADHRIDIYHAGLLLLQMALGQEVQFTTQQIVEGKPRELAQALRQPPSIKVALEKALRRHVADRTPNAKQLWRDLNAPPQFTR
jgi:serine/threonine protein kinase